MQHTKLERRHDDEYEVFVGLGNTGWTFRKVGPVWIAYNAIEVPMGREASLENLQRWFISEVQHNYLGEQHV